MLANRHSPFPVLRPDALRVLALALPCLALALTCFAQQRGDARNAVRLNNLGVAYLNQQLVDKALGFFQQAIAADGTLAVPHLNAGIALLSQQRNSEAKVELERAAKLDGKNPRIWYNLGLLGRSESNDEATLKNFAQVVQIDSKSADAHYFLGSGYSDRKDYEHAISEYSEALRLEPTHASSEFGLARALQRSGKVDGARLHLERFQHLTRDKISSPLAQTYGDDGAYSMAEEIKNTSSVVEPMIPVSFTAMPLTALASASPASAGPHPEVGGGLCLIDLDGHGHPDLIALNEGGRAINFYRHHANGGFEAVAANPMGLDPAGRAVACAVGDFDNDGHPDLAVAMSDRVILYRDLGNDIFEDVTEHAGIRSLNRPAGLSFIDFDHDGDLDLLVTGSPHDTTGTQPRNVLWRNNGNQAFTEWTEPTGLGGSGTGVTAVLSDLNNDRAIDIASAEGDKGVLLYMNQREGKFLAAPLYPEGTLPPAVGLAVLDFNKDGWMDLVVTHTGAPGITLWKNIDGKRFDRVQLPASGLLGAWGVTPIDFDNDGWIDLAVVVQTAQGTGVRVLRNEGTAGFRDVTSQLMLDKIVAADARSVIAADVDQDGDADLIVSRNGSAPLLLRNNGGNRNHSVQIVMHGFADNKTALGTKVEVFAGGEWQKWEISGASGFLSQSAPSILAGLGAAEKPDIVRLLWPTGVPQDEIVTASNRVIEITELDRRGSSCPVVFAWNGTKYEFVSDTIGAAVIGHWISPHQRNTPDPDEWLKVDGSQLKEDHGFLSVRLGEPMEEVNFIDQARLVAIDHPSNSVVFPNERFLNDPPFAQQKTIVARAAHPPLAASDDGNKDVTALLRERDHQYVRDFVNLPYAGFANPHSLTLDLGEWTVAKPLRLLLSGFIEYFSASSLYSAWQAGISPVSPYVEALMPDGSWKRVLDDMGFPAGLPRTIVADLTGKLPAATRKIRITTNLQIYWDQVLISNEEDYPNLVTETELPLASASLAFRGYPKQVDGKTPGDLTYIYEQASATGPFVRQRGMYTAYGDVAPLLASVDNRFAIFGSGEDIDLEFSASALRTLPRGWTRDYFFYVNGYVKDMDYYEAMPFTVASMPFHGMTGYPYPDGEHFPETPDALKYQLDWNDRAESGPPGSSYQFKYVPRRAQPDLPAHAKWSRRCAANSSHVRDFCD